MSPKGEVDKVLDTVVNNLEVTNNLDMEPEVQCRVMMTSTLESYTLGHTIVLSRGLDRRAAGRSEPRDDDRA